MTATAVPIIEEFKSYLTDERHFSPYTAKCYGADLRQYVSHLKAEFGVASSAQQEQSALDSRRNGKADANEPETITSSICEADTDIIRGFLAHLADQNYSPATMARKIATLRSFYKWSHKQGITASNPMTMIRTPKQVKRLPKVVSLEQIEQLLSAPNDQEVLGARDRAMLETLFSTGIRVSELVDLDVQDLDEDGEALLIRGKGKKERLVPLGSHALRRIRHYVEKVQATHRFTASLESEQGPARPVHQQARRPHQCPLRAPQARQVPPPGRSRPGDQPAHAAPQLRDAPAREWCRSAKRAGVARAPVALDDAGVHAPDDRFAPRDLRRRTPACRSGLSTI